MWTSRSLEAHPAPDQAREEEVGSPTIEIPIDTEEGTQTDMEETEIVTEEDLAIETEREIVALELMTLASFADRVVIGNLILINKVFDFFRAKDCKNGDGEGVRSGRCFKCQERGHIAKKCPSNGQEGKRVSRSRSRENRRHKASRSSSKSSRGSSSRGKSVSKHTSKSRSVMKRSVVSSQKSNSLKKSNHSLSGERSETDGN